MSGWLAGGRLHGFGELVYSAFVTAARRRFAPAWTSAQIVRFTAHARTGLRTHGIDLDPRATEILIRQALGDHVTSNHERRCDRFAQVPPTGFRQGRIDRPGGCLRWQAACTGEALRS